MSYAVRLRVMDPTLPPQGRCGNASCCAGGKVSRHSIDHAFCCPKNKRIRTYTHDAARDAIVNFTQQAMRQRGAGRIKVKKEPFCTDDLKLKRKVGAPEPTTEHRADVGITIIGTDGRVERLAVDLTGTHPGVGDAPGAIDLPGPAPAAGTYADKKAAFKTKHYADNYVNTSSVVVPLAWETAGRYDSGATAVLARITRIVLSSFDPNDGRVPSYSSLRRQLAEQLSVAVQRGNARLMRQYVGGSSRMDVAG